MNDERIRSIVLCAAALLAWPAAAQTVVTYRADYAVHYKGREAGSSRFSVTAEADGRYRFVSDSRLSGLVARLVAPKAVVEDSRFRVADGRIQPLAFHYQDGSRKGEDNYTIAFEWPSVASLTTGAGTQDIRLRPGVLDRGSAQVALMFEAAAQNVAGSYAIIDDDGLEPYTVEMLDRQTTESGFGEFSTLGYAQQRVGSSRRTIFRLAPQLHYLPVRIEQIRDGEAETVFVLEDVEFSGR